MADNKFGNQVVFGGYIGIAIIILMLALSQCKKECRTCTASFYTVKEYPNHPFNVEVYTDCYTSWDDKTIRIIPFYPNDTIITKIVCIPNE
jgi:hypothetical protein